MFRLHVTIKEIVMKYLQVAPEAQDVYKCFKFQVLSVAQLVESLRYKPESRRSNPESVIGIFL